MQCALHALQCSDWNNVCVMIFQITDEILTRACIFWKEVHAWKSAHRMFFFNKRDNNGRHKKCMFVYLYAVPFCPFCPHCKSQTVAKRRLDPGKGCTRMQGKGLTWLKKGKYLFIIGLRMRHSLLSSLRPTTRVKLTKWPKIKKILAFSWMESSRNCLNSQIAS